jgi:7-carboxy-7-deazaguanine synthase
MKRSYKVKEIFYTLQGEGGQTGRSAVFCRFTGCNLWSGKESDRSKAACRFCDTDFVGMDGSFGGKYTGVELVETISAMWIGKEPPLVVFTGGEPLLQLDSTLIALCKSKGMEVSIETNGTKDPPAGIDWVTVSPKPRSKQVLTKATEIKLVFPQSEKEMHPSNFEHYDVEYFFLQPLDGPDLKKNIEATINYCQKHPQWRLSLQTHKFLGLQ